MLNCLQSSTKTGAGLEAGGVPKVFPDEPVQWGERFPQTSPLPSLGSQLWTELIRAGLGSPLSPQPTLLSGLRVKQRSYMAEAAPSPPWLRVGAPRVNVGVKDKPVAHFKALLSDSACD